MAFLVIVGRSPATRLPRGVAAAEPAKPLFGSHRQTRAHSPRLAPARMTNRLNRVYGQARITPHSSAQQWEK
ncbi:uncharacterized protein VTP21DRAFT_2472 [Calcarisporiella thermophila]|uniref:uncharacterized protein n=1 Tax=Calcarisporiella thermophila TaxID=911321 RepID=UPI003743D84D